MKTQQILSRLFGQVSWSQPNWLISLRQKIRPAVFLSVLVGLAVLIAAAYFSYHWYQSLPKPNLVKTTITIPPISPIGEAPKPQPLTINFSAKVAPLNLINKEVSKGVTISPEIAGQWQWDNDSTLVFTPKTPWPAGQNYTVNFSKELFTKQTKMERWSSNFTTVPLLPIIEEFRFYQDPTNAKIKKAIATIYFNYPINTKNFADYVTLRLQALKNDRVDLAAKSYKFTVSFDQYKKVAYLSSEPLTLDEVARYLELTVSNKVQPQNGNPGPITATRKVLIPDLDSFFKVTKLAAQIVRDPRNNPEQVLIIETSAGVTTADLLKALHAYQLPAKPAENTEQSEGENSSETSTENKNWDTPGEISPKVLASAKKIDLVPVPTDLEYSTLHSFKFKADSNSQLYIKLDKGVSGYGGYKLNQDYKTLVQAPEYPKEITFLHPGALMAFSSEKKLSVLIRGIPTVKFEFARIIPTEINHLVSQTEGKFSSPDFVNYRFNQENISQIFSEVQTFNDSEPSKVQYTALDFNKYLAKQANTQQHGLFLLTAFDWKNNSPGEIQSKRLILITDMGIVVKDNADGSHDLFVQSITTGSPVANAKVDVLGKNGLPILTLTTDAAGHVTFPTLKDFKAEREPIAYVVHNNDDISFMPYNWADRQLNYSRFDTGGVTTSNQETNLTAFVFTDRGIYRPGDPIHAAAIVKQVFLKPQPAGVPLEATITDPRGTTVLDQKISLPESGYFTLDYQPNETAPTGQYTISVFIVKDGRKDNLLGSTNVMVHEFLPDRMKITTQFSATQKEGWVSPDGLKAEVHLQNLFGNSAENRNVTGKIELRPKTLQFDRFKDYKFTDPLADPNKIHEVSEELPEQQTDAQGNATFDLNLKRVDKGTYQLTFFAEGFEADGGRSVTVQTTQTVSPLQYLVGYKADSDLSYIKLNSAHDLSFLAINPELQAINLDKLRLSLVGLKTITTLVKKSTGPDDEPEHAVYEYQSQIQEVPITSVPFTIAATGTAYHLPTDKIGDFVLRLTDSNNTIISKVNFSVVGAQQNPVPKQAELTVKLNKTEYQPGEEIEMQIIAPYTGAGLISLERDKVYAFNWFKADNTTSMQKIKLPADFRGNGYLTITYVRAWDSNEIFLSPLSYTVVPFSVNHEDQAVKINLLTPQHVRPGEKLPISYSTDKPSKIIVYAVDEGILQVTDYQTPDPLSYFFRKNTLEVMTQQIVDQILPNYLQSRELSAVGGDGGEQMAFKNLNPFKRKTDQPVVYWSGIIDANSVPQVVEYAVPDYFNGAIRVMAVAVADNSAGSKAEKTLVSGDFVIDPNVPTFVAPGDEFEVSVGITNNVTGSGDNAAVQVSLAPVKEFTVIGPAKQSLTIPEGHERTAHFKLRASDQLGSAELNFTASLSDKTSHMHSTLSLRPAAPFNTAIISGYNPGKNNTVTVNPVLYSQYRTLTAELSTSPLLLAKGLQRYLDNNPYLCTEQLTSKAFAILALNESPDFAIDKNRAAEKLKSVIQMLRERELSSGAFSYWPGSNDDSFSAKFATVYALHFLTEVKARGYNIPADLLSNGLSYLKSLVTSDVSDLNMARLQAYAIYVLTRNEIVTTNYITNLQLFLQRNYPDSWQQDLAGAYLAASYQMLKNDNEAQRLIAKYRPDNKIDTDNSFYSSLGNNAQYLIILAEQFPDRLQKLGGNALLPLTKGIADNSYNTLSSAYSTLALSAYNRAFVSKNLASLSIKEILANRTSRVLANTNNLFLSTPFSPDARQLVFDSNSNYGHFYQITQSGFPKALPDKVSSNGIEIYREYRAVNNQSLDPVKLGSEIEVHLKIRSVDDRYIDNIAIVDLLPGGFEVVRDSLIKRIKGEDGNETIEGPTGAEFVDIREDRVLFFTSASSDSHEIVYRIKATNPGVYTVPPIFADSMYDPKVEANGSASKITVQ